MSYRTGKKGYNKECNLDAEAQEYFSHNPKEKEVGFVMLDSDRLKAIRNSDNIYVDKDDIFYTAENEDKE